MSPRRHRRAPQPPPVGTGSRAFEKIEDGPDGRWRVRQIPGGRSDKTYRCPGCDHEVFPGTAHIVAWPDDGAVDERRHWHSSCWRARRNRGPRRQRHGRI